MKTQTTLLTPIKTAAILGICTHTLRRWTRLGIIEAVPFGLRVRYRVEDVQALAKGRAKN